jgi:predicted nuclease of predicted toxin-antitoxin system
MKLLLFDQNLSPRLVDRLADLYSGSVHVSTIGLGTALDRIVWEYARQHDYIIVTKDADFSELSLLLGIPPKVIWIRRGNCSTYDIEILLRENHDAIAALSDDLDIGILTLF